MSLTDRELTDIIRECDYYRDLVERGNYIDRWRTIPEEYYRGLKKCKLLEKSRLIDNPIYRREVINDVFNYKINKPMNTPGVHIKEFFGTPNSNSNIVYILILFLFILVTLKKIL